MYNQSYEDYMRSVLGYSMDRQNYDNNTYQMYDNFSYGTMGNPVSRMQDDRDIEQLYPDIYRMVYPMVCKACDRVTEPITEELIERMTTEIYFAIETDENVDVNINVQTNNRNGDVKNPNEKLVENRSQTKETEETRQRRPRNRFLNDLIRILILRELFGRFPIRPIRPPFPGRPPMRTPFPGGPGRPPRPEPRDWNEYGMF